MFFTHARARTHTLISYLYVHSNNEFIINVLLECIKFLTGTYEEYFIREYPSDIYRIAGNFDVFDTFQPDRQN